MHIVAAVLVVVLLVLQTVATPMKRDDKPTGYADPSKSSSGRMLTIVGGNKDGLGEPLNVIISNKSDPWVLSGPGFTNYSNSLNFNDGELAKLSFGSLQKANLGDGNGVHRQDGLQRYGDLLKEVMSGGNHFRWWIQNGKSGGTGAIFIAASVEKSKDENHMIVDNGYDLGRDWLVGNATKGTTKDKLGNEYKASLAWDNSLLKNIKKKDINHHIGIDGRVAVLTVKVTKKVNTDGKGNNNAATALAPTGITLIIGLALALVLFI